LGNVRLSYFNNGSGAEVLEENSFYPFGLKHEGYNILNGNPAYSYGYNGKELQKETGMSDFGARMYMSDIGRWGVIDPLAESYRRWSPYHYAMNNPANLTDPDGMGSYDADGNWRSEMADFNEYHHLNFSSPAEQYKSFKSDDAGGNGGGGGGATMGDLLDSLLSNTSNYETTEYFKGIDFEQFGADNDEEPVNFFGKNDHKVFHKKYEEMHNRLKNTEGDGIFRVYGHGYLEMIWNEDTQIRNAADFDKAMIAKNKNWKNVDNYKRPILILFSCFSATDVGRNGSIAKQISKAHPKLVVVGFRGFVEYNSSVKGIQKVNKKDGDGNGIIVFYRNGEALGGYYYSEFLIKYKNFK
jgi:RHS repeat-associated protein